MREKRKKNEHGQTLFGIRTTEIKKPNRKKPNPKDTPLLFPDLTIEPETTIPNFPTYEIPEPLNKHPTLGVNENEFLRWAGIPENGQRALTIRYGVSQLSSTSFREGTFSPLLQNLPPNLMIPFLYALGNLKAEVDFDETAKFGHVIIPRKKPVIPTTQSLDKMVQGLSTSCRDLPNFGIFHHPYFEECLPNLRRLDPILRERFRKACTIPTAFNYMAHVNTEIMIRGTTSIDRTILPGYKAAQGTITYLKAREIKPIK